jgi:CBS domain-containing protein
METIENSDVSNLLQGSGVLYRIASFQYHETLDNLMERDIYHCRPDDSIGLVAAEMARRRISSVVVTDEKLKPLGIVTERDMVEKVVGQCGDSISDTRIATVMTADPVYLAPEDSLFDALSVLSRYSIKHLPIVERNRLVGIITLRQIMKLRYAEPYVIISQLEKAETSADFRIIKEELIELVKEKLEANTDPFDIVMMLSLVNAGIHKRLLKKTMEEHGTSPPVDFCFFVTGSHGRKENLLFPDQDYCIILDDYDDRLHNEIDRYFLEIAQQFSTALDEAGFPLCKGNVMGQNPTWRKRISEWLIHVSYIFEHQGLYTVRYVTLIFDSAYLFGEKKLFDAYHQHAFSEISKHHNILRQMHDEEEGAHVVPLGLFNNFITEKSREHRGEINMKRSGLIFIIEAARILALKHGITETATRLRLRALAKKGVIQSDDAEYFENAYRVILYHTLHAQTDNYLSKKEESYYLKPRELSSQNRQILKQAFKAVTRLKDVVASDMGELM